MVRTFTKQVLSTVLSLLLVISTTPFETGCSKNRVGSTAVADAPGAQTGTTGSNGHSGVPLSAEELQQLVAPIALHPDALVAQILGAATFPDQVAYTANWLHQNQNLAGKNLMMAVDAQDLDPSVKALTQFPSLLDDLAKNLSWMSALGEAYSTQPADVMTAVQVLRAKAKAAGNLKSGSQIAVKQQSPQVIVIQSANPQVVYVPTYNPAVVYGSPYVTPGYSTAAVVATGMLAFGAGIAVGAMMSGGCCKWGYSSWNTGWQGTTTVVYRGGAYYGNPAWKGGYYGPRPPYGAPPAAVHYGAGYNSSTGNYGRGATASNGYGTASAGQAYNSKTGTYARGAATTTPYGSQAAGQAYNPRTGASAATQQGSNANGSWGSSAVSKNGNTAYTQHQTTSQGSAGSVQTSNGGKAVGASGKYNNAAVGQAANGNKYATANGNAYSNTGSGWSGSPNNTAKYQGPRSSSTSNNPQTYSSPSSSSAAAKGWGGQQSSGGAPAFSGGSGGGWEAKSASARGTSSIGGSGRRK